eukprot:934104_1
MLSKLQNVKQSLRDVTAAIGDKASKTVAEAKKKINEIQTLPPTLPESWEERIDENGKPYFVDTETGEWYRVKAKQHKRIDTSEKLSIITAESKKEFERAQYLVTMKRFLLSSEEQYVFAFTEYCNINTT